MTSFDPVAWGAVATATLSDAIGRIGAMDAGIRRLSGGHLAGPVHTIHTGVGDSLTVHRGVAVAPPGSVIVIDAQGGLERAVWGGVLTHAATARGVLGVVIDGVVRDLDEIAALGFPVFARGTCPAGPHKAFHGTVGGTVHCGGVEVRPGDVVVGDADGVTVVPAEHLAAALSEVEAVRRREQAWLERIDAGETTASILGLDIGG